MRDKLDNIWQQFLQLSNPVKAGIIIGGGVLIILIILFALGAFSPNDTPLTGAALDNYKASCVAVNFQDLNSNMSKYKGQHLKFTGQIVQINNNNGRTELVISVTPVSGGWSNTNLIYVTYHSQTQFKQGDIVTVYGEISGTYNYFSATIGQLILVKIAARYIELTPIAAPTVVNVPFTQQTNTSNNTTNSSVDNSTNVTPTPSPTPTNPQTTSQSTNGQAT